MGYYYLDVTKRNVEDFPSNLKYLCIVEPVKPAREAGKKTISNEQREKYNEEMTKYKNTIAAFESGHVNVFNNKVRTDDILDFGIDYLFSGYCARMFYIKPIQSEKDRHGAAFVSEFDVVSEIKNEDDLLKLVVSNHDSAEFIAKVFEQGCYSDEGYKERSIEIIEKLNKLRAEHDYDCCECLNNLIKDDDPWIPGAKKLPSKAYDLVIELLERELITLTNEDDVKWELVKRLLQLNWIDLALKVLQDSTTTCEDLVIIKANKGISKMLTQLTDNRDAREIIDLLGLKTSIVTLVVEEEYDNDALIKAETIEFANMNKLRAYLVTEYDIPFDIAAGDITDLYYKGYHFYLI